MLEEGNCIIRVNSIKEPFLLGIPYIKRNSITVSDIIKKNQLILRNPQKVANLEIETSRISNMVNKNHLSLELIKEEIEDSPIQNNNNAISKNDYEKFDVFINKLYSDQEKNK